MQNIKTRKLYSKKGEYFALEIKNHLSIKNNIKNDINILYNKKSNIISKDISTFDIYGIKIGNFEIHNLAGNKNILFSRYANILKMIEVILRNKNSEKEELFGVEIAHFINHINEIKNKKLLYELKKLFYLILNKLYIY